VIAALALALALAQPHPDTVVLLVSPVAWHAPGAAVGAYAPGTGCPDVHCSPRDLLLVVSSYRDARAQPSLAAAISSAGADRVVLVSLPEPGHLGGVAVWPGSGLLHGSSRHAGLLSMADINALVGDAAPATSPGGARDLDALDRREHQRRLAHGWFFTGLIALPMLLYIGLRFGRRRPTRAERRIATALGAYPAAGFLASAVPWWRASPSGVAAVACVLGALAVVLGLGALVARMFRTRVEVGVAAASVLVLAADLLAGGYLQETGIPSYSAITGGRFYGLGNAGFAVLGTAAVVTAWAAARRWGARGWALGLPVLALVALAWWGADFGGAVTLTAGLVAGAATTRRTAVLGSAAGAVVAVGAGVLDHLGGARTHLGDFVSDVWHGRYHVVTRKAEAALSSLASFYPLLVVGSAVMAAARVRVLPDRRIVRALAVLWVLGSVVNDSGITVAAIGMAVAVPLLVAYEP
jgi:hypothetical protein